MNFKNIRKVAVSLLMLSAVVPCQAGDIYVSPKGSDLGEGTLESPLKSVHSALQMAREWRRLNDARMHGGIRIHLREGNYFMERPLYVRPEDSGTSGSPTIISSYAGETAVISGGTAVTGWKAEGHLWVADAPAKTIRQMWVGDKRAIRATQFGENKMERMVGFNKEEKTISIPTPKNIEQLINDPHLEMIVHQRWATAILRVASMKVEGKNTVVSFKEPESYLEFSHPWPQPIINGEMGSSSFCLVNSRTFLDEPGEWYHDEAKGKLYYYPTADDVIGKTNIYVPLKEKLVQIEGCSLNKVKNIEFNKLTFKHSSWNRPAEHGHVTLQAGFPLIDAYKLQTPGLPWAVNLENQAWVARPASAVSANYAERISFSGCTFMNLSCTALDYIEGVCYSSVSNCLFTDIGGTGIMAGSFAEGPTEVHQPYIYANDDVKYCHNISIKSNTVINSTCEDWGAMAIGCGYVRDTRIDSNVVDGCNWSGICIGWGWTPIDCGMRNNHITNNNVTNFALNMHDSGAIYTMSAQPGSTITGNYIDKMGEAPYATNNRAFYIYLDAETDGYTITNNYCPENKYGDNNPGPNIKWGKNGPNQK